MHFNEIQIHRKDCLIYHQFLMVCIYSVLLHNVYTSLFVLCLQIMFLFSNFNKKTAMSSGFSWSPVKQSLQMMTLTVKRQYLQMSRTMKILILQKMLTLKQIKPMVMTLGSYL